MSWFVGIVLGIILLACAGGAGNANAVPTPSSPAMTVPTTTQAPHCGYGPNDNDVRGVVRVDPKTAATNPPC